MRIHTHALNNVSDCNQTGNQLILSYDYRYDSITKSSEHMKPLRQNLLEYLEGKLDFHGLHPILIELILFLKHEHLKSSICWLHNFMLVLFFLRLIQNDSREIPPSVETAFAQRNLDSRTMEAFACFPSPGHLPDPIVVQNPSQPRYLRTHSGFDKTKKSTWIRKIAAVNKSQL
ncbi:hypothetical protein NC651_028414 [Populus alba x Populus x berolinensis]|nr:hypothetical protein NC651_028414 [Populus alba x Populus x berolinensis]